MPRDGSNIYSAPAGTTAVTSTTIESAKYNAFVADVVADLNLVRPVIAGGTGASTLAGLLAAIGGQPLDAALTSLAGLTYAADRGLYSTAADTLALFTLTAAGRAILDDADAAAQRTTLGLTIGTNVQAYDADLATIAGLTRTRGDLIVGGASAWQDLALGSSGQVLTSNGTDAVWAGQPGWGSPVATQTLAVTDAANIITGLGGYRDIMVVIDRGTVSVAGARSIRVGTSGGILSTAIYGVIQNSALQTSFALTESTAPARSGNIVITNFNTTDAIKPCDSQTSSGVATASHIVSASAFDRIQILDAVTANNLTGGTVYVYGRV